MLTLSSETNPDPMMDKKGNEGVIRGYIERLYVRLCGKRQSSMAH